MLLIDEHAESALVKVLETLAQESPLSRGRCLHLKLSEQQVPPQTIIPQITAAAQRHLTGTNPEIYFAEGGDVFLLSRNAPGKLLRLAFLDIADFLHMPADEPLATIYELDVNLNPLLVLLEGRISARQAALAARQKKQVEEEAQRRRQIILEGAGTIGVGDIATRRRERAAAELMVIEDDIFSRRLVENVLKKDYSLTALGTAETALKTYARLAPDVLFLDINLPDVSGHELLQKIIALDPNAYIIMLSGNADQANVMQAMTTGAKGFIAKPFTRDKLLQYIQRCPTIKH